MVNGVQMDPREAFEYLRLIEEYLSNKWLITRDPETKADLERIAAEIAELEKHLG